MKRLLCGVLPAVLLLAAAGCGRDTQKPELDGTWYGETLVGSDGKQRDELARTIRWTIAGDSITVYDPNNQDGVKGVIRIDEMTTPNSFDAHSTERVGAFAWSGIYEVDAKTLKVCYNVSGHGSYGGRPTEFKAKPGILLVMKRVGTF